MCSSSNMRTLSLWWNTHLQFYYIILSLYYGFWYQIIKSPYAFSFLLMLWILCAIFQRWHSMETSHYVCVPHHLFSLEWHASHACHSKGGLSYLHLAFVFVYIIILDLFFSSFPRMEPNNSIYFVYLVIFCGGNPLFLKSINLWSPNRMAI